MKKTSLPWRAVALCVGGCAFVFLTGCATIRDSVPATQIKGTVNGKPFEFVGPKDLTLEKLSIVTATNGTVSIIVENLNAKTNPDVITTTGDAQAKLIKAQSEATVNTLQTFGQFVPK